MVERLEFLRRTAHVASILALLFVAQIAWSQPKQSGAEQRQPENQNAVGSPAGKTEQPAINIQVSNGNQQPRPKTETESQDSSSTVKYATVFMALFSGVLVVVGGLQWNTLKRQAKVMEDQLGVVRSEVNATREIAETTKKALAVANRPRLVLRHVVVKGIDDGEIGEKLSEGYAWIVNVGALPVKLIGFYADWILERRLPLENPMLIVPSMAIEPIEVGAAAFAKFPLPDREITTMDEHRQLWRDENRAQRSRDIAKNLYLIGSFKYLDEIGLRRRYFCYRFSIRQNRFVPERHPNYNYED